MLLAQSIWNLKLYKQGSSISKISMNEKYNDFVRHMNKKFVHLHSDFKAGLVVTEVEPKFSVDVIYFISTTIWNDSSNIQRFIMLRERYRSNSELIDKVLDSVLFVRVSSTRPVQSLDG